MAQEFRNLFQLRYQLLMKPSRTKQVPALRPIQLLIHPVSHMNGLSDALEKHRVADMEYVLPLVFCFEKLIKHGDGGNMDVIHDQHPPMGTTASV